MEAIHHSQAFNFTSAVTGQVDPRTGIFGVNIPIAHIIGNDHMGPELPLTLSYSPLDNNDATYGLGFSDNLTRYNIESRILTLSTGQSYHVKEEKSECTFSHAEPKNFKLLKKNNALWVVYNTGISEKLTDYDTADNIKVVREIYSPAGNKLILDWENFGGFPRLISVSDQRDILLSVSYSSAGESISFDIWPYSDENYSITLVQKGIFLSTVTINTQQQLLTWSLAYSKYGRSSLRHKFLTQITTPTGLVERVEYKRNGHRLPQNHQLDNGAHSPVIIFDRLPYLPYVRSHIIEPGFGVLKQITSYEYSDKNFLGYGGQINELTLYGQDYLYNVENNYQYDSIAIQHNWTENESYLTIRTYNSFHLMIEQKQQTKADNGNILCEKVNQIKYYADVTKSFAEQVPQYQMPKEHTVTWRADGDYRVEKSLSEYDEYCNIILQQDFDETKTLFTYYDVNGEAGTCPAEPNGFKRFLKEQTIYPAKSDFQTPIRKTQYKYDSYPIRNSDSLLADKMVLLSAEYYFSDNAPIRREEIQYYKDATSTNHGRLLEKNVWVNENGNETASFKEQYQWSTLNNKSQIRCITKLTGLKDNLSVSKEQCWTSRAYRLIMEKDTQNNITQYSYNKLGQIISNTLNFDTQYENRMEYSWSFGESGIPISVMMTDTFGNAYKINMDGQGRLVEKYYFTQQVPHGFKIEARQYNLFGKLSSTTHYDLLNPGEASENICQTTVSLKYDHWKENVSQEYNNETLVNDIYDPVKNLSWQQIVSLVDNRDVSSIIKKNIILVANLLD
ncbi:hypothetical protein [Arsenophonus nasoniae]|uniref:hypothetical protein n=1 Tax=Arsenophonus nasoniae TaxID=638 RepID=UPI00387A1A1E